MLIPDFYPRGQNWRSKAVDSERRVLVRGLGRMPPLLRDEAASWLGFGRGIRPEAGWRAAYSHAHQAPPA